MDTAQFRPENAIAIKQVKKAVLYQCFFHFVLEIILKNTFEVLAEHQKMKLIHDGL